MIFQGNPGTGKTTMGRVVAALLKRIGITQSDLLVEGQRDHLVAGYVGQTAPKTQEKIDEACAGVLFVDEAYRLSHAVWKSNCRGASPPLLNHDLTPSTRRHLDGVAVWVLRHSIQSPEHPTRWLIATQVDTRVARRREQPQRHVVRPELLRARELRVPLRQVLPEGRSQAVPQGGVTGRVGVAVRLQVQKGADAADLGAEVERLYVARPRRVPGTETEDNCEFGRAWRYWRCRIS